MSFPRKHSFGDFVGIVIIILAASAVTPFGHAQNSPAPEMSAASHQMPENQQSSASDLPVPQDFQIPEQGALVDAVDIARNPADVPPPVGDRPPQSVKVALIAEELEGKLDPTMKTTYQYWTFNGKVPGPMIRVR